MFLPRRLIAFAVLVAVTPQFAAPVLAQTIPQRPEDLRFALSVFEPPSVDGLRFELANGLPVYVVADRSLPLVDVVLALPVGDRTEAPGEDGLASMTAAMARRGGAGGLDPGELDDAIDALGARIEASSSWGRTVFVLDSGSESVDRGLELLASILFEPRFDEARLAQAKENLRVSLLAAADDPRAVLEREWLRLVHGRDDPRSRYLTEASVAAFDRDALVRFHRRHWSPRGAVIAASGDVDPEALAARLDELFGGWAPRRADAGEEAERVPQGALTAAEDASSSSRGGRATPQSAPAASAGAAATSRPPEAPDARLREAPAASAEAAVATRPLEAPVARLRGTPAESAEDAASTGHERQPAPAAASPGWWMIDRPGAQAAIAIGHRGALFDSWDDPDRWALMLLIEILDGPGAVSRLRSRLQLDEGLTYRVLSYFDLNVVARGPDPYQDGEVLVTADGVDGERDLGLSAGPDQRTPGMRQNRSQRAAERAAGGEFRVFLETAPESAAAAAGVVLQELRRLQGEAVAAAELETARQSVLARLPLLFDRAETIAGRFAEDELLDRPHEYWSVYRERLEAVTAADIRRAARRFLDPDGVALLVVGDWNVVRGGGGFQELRRTIGPPRALEEAGRSEG